MLPDVIGSTCGDDVRSPIVRPSRRIAAPVRNGDRTERGDAAGGEVMSVVEENSVVGKRDVSRGGVSETPVREQVRLRDERVDLERRAVDQPPSAPPAAAGRQHAWQGS